MLIGQDVQRTERVLQVVVSTLDRVENVARKVFHTLQCSFSMVEDNETIVKLINLIFPKV
jgi:hypothetical protein